MFVKDLFHSYGIPIRNYNLSMFTFDFFSSNNLSELRRISGVSLISILLTLSVIWTVNFKFGFLKNKYIPDVVN